MSKMFSKGQLVTFLQNWDSRGTVRIADLVVHSCGAKQMVLVDEQGAKYEGRNFLPGTEQWAKGRVLPRLSQADAEAAALALGAEIVAHQRVHFDECIARYGYPETNGYTKAIRQSIAELHEPRVVRPVRNSYGGLQVVEARP